ncbi:MAG: hypothetical protein IJU71_05295, partial [Selenomonadaceae bacterium]|nr:hypothetical protein [Selenomonadaceae bacterium]
MKRRDFTMISAMLRLLYVYNAFVVMSLAIFMCITQRKIIQSMTARSFLENISAPPASSTEILLWSATSFIVLSSLGKFYRRAERTDIRNILFASVFQLKVIRFEEYLSYYNSSMQTCLAAVKNIFSSLNVVIFVFYMVMIVKNRHEEKERI